MKIAFVVPWYGEIPGGAESEYKNHTMRCGLKIIISLHLFLCKISVRFRKNT